MPDAPSFDIEDVTTHDFILCLFGLFALDGRVIQAFPTSIVIAVLALLDVSETAVRVTLTRMVHRGILTRKREGRITVFTLTHSGVSLLKQSEERVFRQNPFGAGSDGWTMLNALPPSSPPARRYHFQQRLLWAGFGEIDTRMWIAPGYVDVEDCLSDMFSTDELSALCAMHGVMLPITNIARLVRKAWNVEHIRSLHDAFIAEWETYRQQSGDALTSLIRIAMAWASLLRADPGLPGAMFEASWPSERSAAVFQRLFPLLRKAGDTELLALCAYGA